jgi:RHS repeat-associated protein
MHTASGVSYPHNDQLGSASLTTGATSNSARYLPFGGTRWESGSTPTDFQFTGQRKEAGFGLYDYNARYYDPLIGRFISADTVVPDPLYPQNLNRYSYTRNNPLRYTDSTGHCEVVCFAAIGIGIGIALIVALANPDPVIAPSHGYVPQPRGPTSAQAYFDSAPGTGDISDIWTLATEHRLFTGEYQSRSEVAIAALVPIATGGMLKLGAKASRTIQNYGIKPFEEFTRPLKDGDAIHHLVEKRFWRQMGFASAAEAKNKILGVEIGQWLHGPTGRGGPTITDQLRDKINHRLSDTATLQEIWEAHRDVYREFGYDDWVDLIWESYFKNSGVTQ